MTSEKDAYDELCCYTLTHGGDDFIHQHVVDAFAAQHATPQDKPIRLTFALVGLYLHVEKGFSGRDVQLAHMKLGQRKQEWPTFEIPEHRGSIGAKSVLATSNENRDALIHHWTEVVWQAYSRYRDKIEKLLKSNAISDRRSVVQSVFNRKHHG